VGDATAISTGTPTLPVALFKTPMWVGAPYNDADFMSMHYDMIAFAFQAAGDEGNHDLFRKRAEWARTEWAEKRADV